MADKLPKTKAREIADQMERDRMQPLTAGAARRIKEDEENNPSGARAIGRGIVGAPLLIGAGAIDTATRGSKKPRSEEEMNELAREVSKGMKKGGKVKSASARADGCCIRGKTRA